MGGKVVIEEFYRGGREHFLIKYVLGNIGQPEGNLRNLCGTSHSYCNSLVLQRFLHARYFPQLEHVQQ